MNDSSREDEMLVSESREDEMLVSGSPEDEMLVSGIKYDVEPFTLVTEGKAEVDFPSSLDVFYNPVQEFNRDLSISVIRLFASDYKLASNFINKEEGNQHFHTDSKTSKQKRFKLHEHHYNIAEDNTSIISEVNPDPQGICVLEALAASGLRSIRYAKEVGGIKQIVANDLSRSAIECMKNNLERNGVSNFVEPSLKDASLLMYERRDYVKQFQVLDLDPYGSPHTFLDGAVQSIGDGGLLLVTCTDMAVLCGNTPETCYIKYGALSMKHKACHEMALRIVLQCIESNANKYSRYIVPLISLSADFYVRVFVKVFTSQQKCKQTFSKVSWVHSCTSCESTTFQPLGKVINQGKSVRYELSNPAVDSSCSYCGGQIRTAGPIWNGPIHDKNFVKRLKITLVEGELNTYKRIYGTLTMMEEELDVPLYHVVDQVAKVLRMSSFKTSEFMYALFNAGYSASQSHACRNAVKTDAPQSFIWDIMKAKNKKFPVSIDKYLEPHPARRILFGESYKLREFSSHLTFGKVSFEPNSKADFASAKVLRFQVNPMKNWGPKCRAVTSLFHGDLREKSLAMQGKNKHKKKEKLKKFFKSKRVCINLEKEVENKIDVKEY